MFPHAKSVPVAIVALLLGSASVTSTAAALDAGGAASSAAGAASGAASSAAGAASSAAGAASDAASSAAGAASDAASSATGAASDAASSATGAVSGATSSVTGAGQSLGGGGKPSTFSARGLFGLETPAYGKPNRSVSRSRGSKKAAAHARRAKPSKPAKHKPPKEDDEPIIESTSGDAVDTVRRRRMCGDILGDPAGYDPALVRLCRRVSSR
jgi:hypothetical protein